MNLPIAQGDILFIPTDALPADVTPVDTKGNRHVLADGEQTGHAHTIERTSTKFFTSTDVSDLADKFVQTPGGTPVKHQEHAPVILPAGDWVVRRQREYTPAAIVRVAD